MQECDGYGEWLRTPENLELKTAFFSNATKNKHDKDCSTSFEKKIENNDTKLYKYDSYDLRKKCYFLIIGSITWHLIKLIVNYGYVKIQ